ncbi:MAG: cbb3-type cytochrome c oxidase subunit I [Leptospirales bacterium]
MMKKYFQRNISGEAARILFLFALFSIFITLFLGLLLSNHRIFPEFKFLPFQVLRPLHTLFALSWVINGSIASVLAFMKVNLKAEFSWIIPALFLTSAGFIMSGNFTGREYIAWPPFVSIVFILLFISLVFWFFASLKKAYNIFSESTWMIALGLLLLPASLIESNYYLFHESISIGRDIAIEWHAIDSLFGSVNLIGYGILSFILRKQFADSVSSWKFQFTLMISLVGLLLTFGHHFYPSPQPSILKTVAFTASMVAIASLWLKRFPEKSNNIDDIYITFAMYSVYWTLFSIVTGVLMSIPSINNITHGTYFVVAHSMGSLIGVNTFIILSAIFYLTKEGYFQRADVSTNQSNNYFNKSLLLKLIFYFNITLMIFVTILSVTGLMANMPIESIFLSSGIMYKLIFATGSLLFALLVPIIFAAIQKLYWFK